MNVLLAIDESACSDVAVETVAKQFSPETTEIRVLNVINWPGGAPTILPFAEGPVAADHILGWHDELQRSSRELVARAVDRLRAAGFRATGDSREGDARAAILRAAAEWPSGTIVLGSHGRHGLDRVLTGSVAEYVLRHAPCAVEIVRPAPRVGLTRAAAG